MTRQGQPLSYNRAPSADLSPWIGRLYVTRVHLPADYTLSCGLFNDFACLRIQLAGHWEAETAQGRQVADQSAAIFGPQTHRMPIRVTGSFISLGFTIRPGACTVLNGPRMPELVDRLMPTDATGIPQSELLSRFTPAAFAEDWVATLEAIMRERIEAAGGARPDPVAARFEQLSYNSPSMTVAQAAQECGVERRRLERIVHRDFGLTPKQVLRRARALDMASQLRGVGDSAEADDIILRYYDESHLIHEFTQLFGMSPGQFVATPQPLMTLSLESRQARRLEELRRLEPGQLRPWMEPES